SALGRQRCPPCCHPETAGAARSNRSARAERARRRRTSKDPLIVCGVFALPTGSNRGVLRPSSAADSLRVQNAANFAAASAAQDDSVDDSGVSTFLNVTDLRRIGRIRRLLAKNGPSLQLSRRESVDTTQSNHQG